jgi:hypothetical protein
MFLGDINTVTWSSRLGVGCKADDFTRKKYCSQIQRNEHRMINLVESSVVAVAERWLFSNDYDYDDDDGNIKAK